MTRKRASAGHRLLFPHVESKPATNGTAVAEREDDAPGGTRRRLGSAGYRTIFGSNTPAPNRHASVTTIVRPRRFTGNPGDRFSLWLPRVAASAEGLRLGAAMRALIRALPLLLLIGAACAIHAVNMFDAPFYFDDEGIYMSQAWSVATSAKLAPYTYFYDHPPLGWFTIAAWVTTFGGFGAFGTAVNAGRVLMLVVHGGSTWLVYQNTRRLGGSAIAAVVALSLFAISPFQIIFGREVLLDNLATFWMLLSLHFATARPLKITTATLSGTAMGLALLNKEIVGPMLPGLLLVAWVGLDRQVRWIGVSAWLFPALGIASLYPLFALLKGELFPYGSVVDFASKPHVSLIDAVLFHQRRASDHGIFERGSLFWDAAHVWWQTDPALVVATLCSLLAAVLLARKYRGLLGVGVMLGVMLAFLARGGVVFDFWLLSAVPLVAITIGITAGYAYEALPSLWRGGRLRRRVGAVASFAIVAAIAAAAVMGRASYADSYQRVFTHDETRAQTQAVSWVDSHVDHNAFMVIDTYAYVDLRGFDNAHSFWKVDLDPAVKDGVLGGDWRRINYIVLTPVMSAPIGDGQLPLVAQALAHSKVVARFESGGNWVEIRSVQPNADTAVAGGG